MTIQDLGSVGELVAAIATVVTLVYLAVQIRSNTSATRSAAAQSVHEAFTTWYRLIAADASLGSLTAEGLRNYSGLPEADKPRFVALCMAFSFCAQDAFLKWRQGSLSPELWRAWELVFMNFVHAPGGKEFWNERGYLFGDTFREHVENDLLKRESHPLAKPLGAFPIGLTPHPDA